jgi:hypothetical protein
MARLCQTTRSIKEAVTPGYTLEHCEWSTGGEKVHTLVDLICRIVEQHQFEAFGRVGGAAQRVSHQEA